MVFEWQTFDSTEQKGYKKDDVVTIFWDENINRQFSIRIEEIWDKAKEWLIHFNDQIRWKSSQEIVAYVDHWISTMLDSMWNTLKWVSPKIAQIMIDAVTNMWNDIKTRVMDWELSEAELDEVMQLHISRVKKVIDEMFEELFKIDNLNKLTNEDYPKIDNIDN